MNSSQLLGITTLSYLFASLLYLIIFIFKAEKKLGKLATVFTFGALAIQTIAIGLRWQESYVMGIGHAPLTNMYESVVFFSWTIVAIYLFMEWKFQNRMIGAFTLPFAALAMMYGSLSTNINKGISPLVPALQSNWLISHVVTCFVGYASFTIAAGLGIMYLLKSSPSNNSASFFSRLPELPIIDDLVHKTMVFGFIWLSAGIITGAVWANSAWGTYWSWDPKETWSLITWFVYAITLHTRYTRGWSGRRIAWLSLVGFASVIFTYYGVNFLLAGLHSYGSN